MKYPEKAIILAAGLGTRFLPLSRTIPKPIMPLWGKPILGHILDALQTWHIKEVLINLHHKPDYILHYLRQRSELLPRIRLSFEPQILGTGGMLRKACWFLDNSPFWIINGDIAFNVNPEPFLKAFSIYSPLAVLWLYSGKGPQTVEMRHGRISSFRATQRNGRRGYTFCGLHLLSADILKYIPERKFSSIIEAYEHAIAVGKRITGICVSNSFWRDIGEPEAYLQAHAEVQNRFTAHLPGGNLFDPSQLIAMKKLQAKKINITGFLAQSSDIIIENGAILSNAVIWDHVKVGRNAVVENAILGRGTHVTARTPRFAVCADAFGKQKEQRFPAALFSALAKLRWRPEATTVIPFEPRGSHRDFTRLQYGRRRAIMIQYQLERSENMLYAQHARFLKEIGIPVPAILLEMPEHQCVIMQDLGDMLLQRLIPHKHSTNLQQYYRTILRAVIILYEQGTEKAKHSCLPMLEPFSANTYQSERELFDHYFLKCYLELSKAKRKNILDELHNIAQHLLKSRPVLIHRDLQSSNIIFVRGKPYFLDFQGMRFGSVAYDIASLLTDPYVQLPIQLQLTLLREFNSAISPKRRISEETFWLASVERLA